MKILILWIFTGKSYANFIQTSQAKEKNAVQKREAM